MDSPVRPGDILAQKYRVDRVLGVGGMGVVVAATHLDLDQHVAVKFMLDKAFEDPTARARFLREARVVGKLKSEHVAQVRDSGTLESGAPYIVMEYLEGTDLAGMLRDYGPLPVPLAVELVVQACDALAEAHSQGIVHRDLKPANLFVTQRSDGTPLVKVLDFGISKTTALNDASTSMTRTSAMMGSPLYMSPEQMRSARDVDQRTDVWSLGIVLYELLAGTVPFRAETLGELLYTVMTLQHPPMQAMTPRQDIPPEIGALVDWCLMKEPAQRAPNVAEIVRRLAPFCPPRIFPTIERISAVMHVSPPAGGSPLATSQTDPTRPMPFASSDPARLSSPSSPSQGQPTAPPVQQVQTSAGWGGTSPDRPRASRAPWIAGGVGAAALLVVGGLVVSAMMRHTDSPAATSASATATVEAPLASPPAVAPPAAATASAAEPVPPATAAAPDPAPPHSASAALVVKAPPAPAAAPRPGTANATKPPSRPGSTPGPSTTGGATPKPLAIPDTSK
jgi:serine/threonine protein kinase